MTAVTAGWLMANLRNNWAQLPMPNSVAHVGNAWFLTRENSLPSSKVRLMSTATPLSWANGNTVFAASGAFTE
ncbi:hypothetical protein D3C81_1738090 [compost metagenome]